VTTDADRVRLERRYSMLADLENYQKTIETPGVVKARDEFYEKAHGIITGPTAKGKRSTSHKKTDKNPRPLSAGTRSVRAACSPRTAHRTRGVQFVTVTDGGWDNTHGQTSRA